MRKIKEREVGKGEGEKRTSERELINEEKVA